MTVSDLTVRDWQAIAEMPALRGLLSNELARWLADFCHMTMYEAQECGRQAAARQYLCATGRCGHAEANRPARRDRL